MGQAQENEINVRIVSEIGALKPGLEASAQDVERASERMRNSVADMNQAIGLQVSSLTSTIGNVGGALSALFGVLAGGASFRSAIDETKKLTGEANGLAKALGISTTEASALNVALGDIYSSSEAFIGASQMLGRQLRTNESDLNAMGLKTRDANGNFRNMKDLMFDAISVLRGYKEGVDRTMAAQSMFGRGGADVLSMLKLTSDAMDEARQKAEELGLTIGEGNVKALREYKAAMNDLDDVISAAKKAIGEDLMPHLTDMANWLSSAGPDAVNTLRSQIDTLGTVAIGTVLTGSIRAMSLRLADATTSLISTTQATRQAATAKLEAAQAAARSTAAIRDHAVMLMREAEAAVASATGMARLSAVTNTLIPARERLEAATRAAAIAERQLSDAATASSMTLQVAGSIINALGGPLGAVITLLGVGATAWTAFGDKAKSAVDLVNDEIEKGRAALARYQREKKFGTGDEGQLRASLETVENKISILVQTSGSKAAAENLLNLRKEAEELQSALNDIEAGKGKKSDGGGRGYVPPPEKAKADPHKSEMPTWEAELSARKSAYMRANDMKEMSLEDEKAYWNALSIKIGEGAKESGAVRKKASDLDLQILKKQARDGNSITAEGVETWKRLANLDIDIQQQAADELFSLGKISKEERLQLDRQFEQERYEIARQGIELRNSLIDEKDNPVEYQKLKNQLLEIDRKHALEKRKIETQIKAEQDRPFANMFKGLESSFSQAASGMLLRAQTLRQAIGSVFQNLANSAINEFTKIGLNWAITETHKTAATQAGAATRAGVEKVAAGESILANSGAALKKIMSDAYEAAAGAYKAVVGIPVVGPVLAPAAAGVAFGAVAAYSAMIPSAEGGWDIPAGATGLMRYHEREMMLPAQHADTIRKLGENGSALGGAQVNFNISAMDGQDVRRVLLKNSHHIVSALKDADRKFTR